MPRSRPTPVDFEVGEGRDGNARLATRSAQPQMVARAANMGKFAKGQLERSYLPSTT
jgi:hypothetical protein